MPTKSLAEIEERVRAQLETAVGSQTEVVSPFISGQFKDFQDEEEEERALTSFYEKFCDLAGQYLSFAKLSDSQGKELAEDIRVAGLHVDPSSVLAATILSFLLTLGVALPLLILGMKDAALFLVCTGLFLSYVCFTYPSYRAEIIKIQAQQESILAILYMTIYMRLNPVLENAIYFATQHLSGPLGKDLKRLLWLLDTQKVSSVEQGINEFMELWILRNKDFVVSLLTLHSILTQADKQNQERILDKSLNEMLNSTYEQMKHYSNDLKMPVVLLHTFGILFPLIGLIAFPMLSIFMAESINISYLFFGYLAVLPALLYFLMRRILSKRPGAFSFPDLSHNPALPPKGKYALTIGGTTYLVPILPVAIIVGLLITIPGFYHLATSTYPLWLDAQQHGSIPRDEYEIGAMIMTTTIPLGLAVGVLIYFYFSSAQKIKLRDTIMEIEDDLGGAIFQLSNQFTENIPVEVAIENFVHEFQMLNLKKRSIFYFFSDILDRMQDEGVTFVKAVFDLDRGVLVKYPSVLLKEIIWVMIEGAQKGSVVLYNVITKVSTYLDNVKKIKELIYDLLNETVSSINLQAKFLAPFLAGLVGSLTLIIIRSLSQMMQELEKIMKMMSIMGQSAGGNFFEDFIKFSQVTPPTVFQVLVGIYAVETVVLLSLLANGVENGFDETSRNMQVARNLVWAIGVYMFTIIVGAFALNMLVARGLAAGNI